MLDQVMKALGYTFHEVTNNTAYRLFLGNKG